VADEREQAAGLFDKLRGAVPVLNAGRDRVCAKQQSYRIDERVALDAFDFLARIVGEASRPSASRQPRAMCDGCGPAGRIATIPRNSCRPWSVAGNPLATAAIGSLCAKRSGPRSSPQVADTMIPLWKDQVASFE
jgi:hypothetical protein